METFSGLSVKKRSPKMNRDELTTFLTTNNGYKLTRHEALFIENYLKTGNVRRAAEDAGCPGRGGFMLSKDYIRDEISFRMEEEQNDAVADRREVMQYFTSVMRGEIKDQFGLDAPLSERTSAAKELAKRIIDIPAENEAKSNSNKIVLTLDWNRN